MFAPKTIFIGPVPLALALPVAGLVLTLRPVQIYGASATRA
jgi:hypothetical protein